MKRTFWLIPVILASFVFLGCPTDDSGEDIWLADLQNPFIGEWESLIPSMGNARMVSEFKTDGTLACGFPAVEGYEGPFNGGYFVTGDIMVDWLDFEGTAAYKFKVVDNNTISVTEIVEVKQGGELTLGHTTPFTRVAGSTVNKENKPLSLNNVFIGGKWKSQIPSMNNAEMVSEFKSDGTFTCGFPVVQGFEGPFIGGYLVFEDKMVSWVDFEGAAAYKFEAVDTDTINVTEINEVKQGGVLTLGNTSAFTRVTD